MAAKYKDDLTISYLLQAPAFPPLSLLSTDHLMSYLTEKSEAMRRERPHPRITKSNNQPAFVHMESFFFSVPMDSSPVATYGQFPSLPTSSRLLY